MATDVSICFLDKAYQTSVFSLYLSEKYRKRSDYPSQLNLKYSLAGL